MKRTALLLSWVVSLMVVTPAQAQSSVDDVTKSLQSNPVYVASDIEGTTSNTAGELLDQLRGGDNILIVILPDRFSDTAELASKLGDGANRKYIIGIAVGDELEAASNVLPQGVADDLLRRARSVSTSNIETLRTFIRNTHNWQAQHPDVRPVESAEEKKPVFAYFILAVSLSLLVVIICREWMR